MNITRPATDVSSSHKAENRHSELKRISTINEERYRDCHSYREVY